MYAQLFNVMKMQASLTMNGVGHMRVATVSSYDPATYAVKVLLKPEDTESGWMPILTPMSGNEWGIYCPPQLGDCAIVGFQEGDKESGFVVGFFFNDVDRPTPVESGEVQIINKTGSKIILKKNGDIEFDCSAQNINATCESFTINGKLHVTGDIKSDAQIEDFKSRMEDMRDTYNSHTHTDPQGGVTGTPSAPM